MFFEKDSVAGGFIPAACPDNSGDLDGIVAKTRNGIPSSIREWGVDEAAFFAGLDELSEKASDDQCTGANPRYPLIAEIRELYLSAYYSRGPQAPGR